MQEKVDWNQRYVEANTPWDSGVPSEELKRVLADGLVKPCRVLELGCGTGTNAIFLAQSGFDVTAVDLSPEALRQANSKAEEAGVTVEFVQADVTALPELGDPFSFVFDRGTYHVVRQSNLAGFCSTLKRVVAPSGFYLVLTGNANDEEFKNEGPPKVTARELCEELEGADFNLLSLREIRFQGVKIDGRSFAPLAWAALLKRRLSQR